MKTITKLIESIMLAVVLATMAAGVRAESHRWDIDIQQSHTEAFVALDDFFVASVIFAPMHDGECELSIVVGELHSIPAEPEMAPIGVGELFVDGKLAQPIGQAFSFVNSNVSGWGFSISHAAGRALQDGNAARVLIHPHNETPLYLDFHLRGSRDAIWDAYSACKEIAKQPIQQPAPTERYSPEPLDKNQYWHS